MPLYLEPNERLLVLPELVKALVAARNEAAFFSTYLGIAVVASIEQPGTTQGWATSGLAKCEASDYRSDSTHPLLNLLKDLTVVNAAILAIHKRLDSIPRPANPFTAETLDNGQVFLDRGSFRSGVTKLMAPAGPVVLRVSGDPKSGKWYSYMFLRFLSLNGNAINPVRILCEPSLTGIAMAQTLLMRMGAERADWQTPPIRSEEEKTESPLRIGQVAADWFFNRVLGTGRNWWFFVKFTDNSIAADTREFIRQLAFNIANAPDPTRILRLILVNFVGDLPPDLRRLQIRDNFELDRQAWESHALAYIARLGSALPADRQAELSLTTQELVSTLRNASNQDFLSTLCDELEDLTEEINA